MTYRSIDWKQFGSPAPWLGVQRCFFLDGVVVEVASRVALPVPPKVGASHQTPPASDRYAHETERWFCADGTVVEREPAPAAETPPPQRVSPPPARPPARRPTPPDVLNRAAAFLGNRARPARKPPPRQPSAPSAREAIDEVFSTFR